MSKPEHCGITEYGVDCITITKQLEELVLGKLSDYSEEPEAKTQVTYKYIFRELGNLKKLEMREPTFQKIYLREQWVMQAIATSAILVSSCPLEIYRD